MQARVIRRLLWAAFSISISLLARGPLDAAETSFRVAEGFSLARVASPPHVIFPMFAALADDGALFVAESSGLDLYAELQKQTRRCRISRLEDRDWDGAFEHANVFADGLVFPMGLVWHKGNLYAADPPDVIVLKDTNGDGRADLREVLITGFGHTDNGSLHGLIFGRDGWLYLTMGQPDGYRIKRKDGTVLEGKSGALLRCRADGSDIEVVARGFENLVEIEFMPTGEIVGTDNWFSRPEGGQRDALVHVMEGGVYPLNAHAKTERDQFYSGTLLPPMSIYPAVALSGLTRYRGGQFPARHRDALFTAQFNARRIVAHRWERHGATFRTADEDFLTTDDPDFHPSDVLEDVDGSLLVVDTGAWYVHHCPTGRIRPAPAQGGIYRVAFGSREKDPALRPDRRTAVMAAAETRRSEAVRRAGPMLEDLNSADPDVALRAAGALARGRPANKTAEASLVRLLSHARADVRRAAAEALGHCGSSRAIAALTTALATDLDPILEHALLYALHQLADRSSLEELLEHRHARVQQVALSLLDQAPHRSLKPEAVLKRAAADDDRLRRTAQSILQKHPEWSAGIRPWLTNRFQNVGTNELERAGVRDLVVAFQHDLFVQRHLARSLTNSQLPAHRRVLILEAMAHSTLTPWPTGWVAGIEDALGAEDAAVCLQAVRTLERRRMTNADARLLDLATRTNRTTEVQWAALRAVLPRRPQLNSARYQLLLDRIHPRASPSDRLTAAELLGRAKWGDATNDPGWLLRTLAGDRLISISTLLPLLLQSQGEGFQATCHYLAERVERDWAPSDADARSIHRRLSDHSGPGPARLESQLSQRAAVKSSQSEQLDAYDELLTGGDPESGRKAFREKAGCTACHRIDGEGGMLGPDLSRIGGIRAGRDLLESIVLPSATFAQGYETFRVTFHNGEELTGVQVRQDDDSFVLREGSGREVRLDPSQVKDTDRSQISLMPEGLLGALSRDEIRNLLAYLQHLK